MAQNPLQILPSDVHRISTVITQAAALREQFMHLSAADRGRLKTFGEHSALKLEIAEDGHVIDATLAGTTVRFRLLIVSDQNEDVIGRVHVTHEHALSETERSLTNFHLTSSGNAGLQLVDGRTQDCRMSVHAELIVAHFLSMAFQNNAKVEVVRAGDR